MIDKTAVHLEQTILQHRILPVDVDWANELVFPYYDGLSIRNLAHTVVRLLDVRPQNGYLGTAPLQEALWQPHWGRAQRVILFISDGFGWRFLQQLIEQDDAIAQIVADLTGDGSLTPITSIAPSTTAAAMPCIWTGSAPAATGMAGTTLFLRELGLVADMLALTPVSARRHVQREALADWGLDLDSFLPRQTLGERLSDRQIDSYLVLQKDLFGSGLSRLMHRGIGHTASHVGYSDLWLRLRDVLQETRGKRCFVNIYWSAVDSISHLYGTVSEYAINEVRRQLSDLRDVLLAEDAGDGRTLFMLAADHGHSPVLDTVSLSNYTEIASALRATTGDGRFAHLFLRDGTRPAVTAAVREQLGDQVACLPAADALEAGLFGPEKPYEETASRIGDLLLVAREGTAIQAQAKGQNDKYGPISRHAGLSAREMLVPLLMRPL